MACYTCQGCYTCESTCYSCQGCYSCNVCDSCQLCDGGCQAIDGNACVKSEAFCETEQKLRVLCNDKFTFSPCPQTTTRMAPATATFTGAKFTKASWDAIRKWISQRADYGDATNGALGGTDMGDSATADVAPFSAVEFNRVAAELGAEEVQQYSKIEGKYFTALETAAFSYKISDLACDKCNTDCNVTCCICQKYVTGDDKCSSQKCSSQKCSSQICSSQNCGANCQQTT